MLGAPQNAKTTAARPSRLLVTALAILTAANLAFALGLLGSAVQHAQLGVLDHHCITSVLSLLALLTWSGLLWPVFAYRRLGFLLVALAVGSAVAFGLAVPFAEIVNDDQSPRWAQAGALLGMSTVLGVMARRAVSHRAKVGWSRRAGVTLIVLHSLLLLLVGLPRTFISWGDTLLLDFTSSIDGCSLRHDPRVVALDHHRAGGFDGEIRLYGAALESPFVGEQARCRLALVHWYVGQAAWSLAQFDLAKDAHDACVRTACDPERSGDSELVPIVECSERLRLAETVLERHDESFAHEILREMFGRSDDLLIVDELGRFSLAAARGRYGSDYSPLPLPPEDFDLDDVAVEPRRPIVLLVHPAAPSTVVDQVLKALEQKWSGRVVSRKVRDGRWIISFLRLCQSCTSACVCVDDEAQETSP